jgi:hypothetical protein
MARTASELHKLQNLFHVFRSCMIAEAIEHSPN